MPPSADPAIGVLVVDPDADRRAVEVRVLRDAGYAVGEAADGPAALLAVRQLRPQLALLAAVPADWPTLETLRQLRQAPAFEAVSVVLLGSASVPSEHLALALDLDADGVIASADDPRVLLAWVRWHLRRGLAGRRHAAAVRREDDARLARIGTLAGGIAHDLNNVLAPVLMSIGILQMDEHDPERLEILATIEQGARRGAEVVSQVLSIARGLGSRRLEVQVRHLLRDIQTMARDSVPGGSRLEIDAPADLWTCWADPAELHEMLLNLCAETRDAMPDGDVIRIVARNVVVERPDAAPNAEAPGGPCVRIDILDHRHGPGAGAGAAGGGLAAALAMVASHGGFVQERPGADLRTRFRIFLPAMNAGGEDGRQALIAEA